MSRLSFSHRGLVLFAARLLCGCVSSLLLNKGIKTPPSIGTIMNSHIMVFGSGALDLRTPGFTPLALISDMKGYIFLTLATDDFSDTVSYFQSTLAIKLATDTQPELRTARKTPLEVL